VAFSGEKPAVLRPRRLAVHHDPHAQGEECWRCEALADAGQTANGRPRP
jgi:hypothetical protein